MTLPVLVAAGDMDFSSHFSERQDGRANAYRLSPSPKTLLTVFGAEHPYGGIISYDANDATDDNLQRLAEMQRLTWAYLRSALYAGDKFRSTIDEEFRTAVTPVPKGGVHEILRYD